MKIMLSVLLLAMGTAPPADSPSPQGLRWGPCPGGGGAAGVECARIEVPVDWSMPRGRTITLTLGRLRAERPTADSVLVNFGGPGGPAVGTLRDNAELFADLRRRMNVVTWDIRGYASVAGNPDLCQRSFVRTPRIPRNQAEFDALAAANRSTATTCRDTDPELFDHLDTASHARDMDAIRRALGQHRLNVYGASYGGIFAQTYARLFPHRVRTVALDGTWNHSARDWAREQDAAALDNERFLQRFFDWCAAEPACVLHGHDVPALWQAVLATAGRSPIPAAHTSFDDVDLQSLALGFARQGPASWAHLARAIDQAARGDASSFTTVVPYPGVAAPGLTECLDLPRPASQAELAATIARLRRVAPHTGPAATAVLLCVGWPVPVTNPPAPLPRHLPPMLNAGNWGEFDAAGRAVAQVRGSGGVYHDGPGHTLYLVNACARRHIDRYLAYRVLPPPETTCP